MNLEISDNLKLLKENIILKKERKLSLRFEYIKALTFELLYMGILKYDEIIKGYDNSKYWIQISEAKRNRKLICNPEIYKIIDGIKFISDSQESLEKLISFYISCKQKISSMTNTKMLLDNLKNNNCIITDLSPHLNKTNNSSMTSYIDKKTPAFIYYDKDTISNLHTQVFLHEIGHFYDMGKSIKEIISLLDEMIIEKEKLTAFLRNANDYEKQLWDLIKQELDNSKNIDKLIHLEFNEKESEKTIKKYNSFHERKVKNLTENIFDSIYLKSGIDMISDIIQAVVIRKRINLKEKLRFGHQDDYYENKANVAGEIFANFCCLYTLGLDGILDEIFPKEFREKLTKIYINTISENNISKVLKKQKYQLTKSKDKIY